MTVCPCGCQGRVAPHRVYASKGCYLRAHKGLAQQMGREGGKTKYVVRGAAIVEKFAHLDRHQAILAAIAWGEKRRRQREYRERRRGLRRTG